MLPSLAQCVKDLVLLPLWLGSDPWPRSSICHEAAKKENAKYCVDVYPHYGSDVEATVAAGADVAFGLIGSGVYASHGYERSHKEGVKNTLKLIKGYLNI